MEGEEIFPSILRFLWIGQGPRVARFYKTLWIHKRCIERYQQ